MVDRMAFNRFSKSCAFLFWLFAFQFRHAHIEALLPPDLLGDATLPLLFILFLFKMDHIALLCYIRIRWVWSYQSEWCLCVSSNLVRVHKGSVWWDPAENTGGGWGEVGCGCSGATHPLSSRAGADEAADGPQGWICHPGTSRTVRSNGEQLHSLCRQCDGFPLRSSGFRCMMWNYQFIGKWCGLQAYLSCRCGYKVLI